MPRLAPEIFRKRLLLEGYSTGADVDAAVIREYFGFIADQLGGSLIPGEGS